MLRPAASPPTHPPARPGCFQCNFRYCHQVFCTSKSVLQLQGNHRLPEVAVKGPVMRACCFLDQPWSLSWKLSAGCSGLEFKLPQSVDLRHRHVAAAPSSLPQLSWQKHAHLSNMAPQTAKGREEKASREIRVVPPV